MSASPVATNSALSYLNGSLQPKAFAEDGGIVEGAVACAVSAPCAAAVAGAVAAVGVAAKWLWDHRPGAQSDQDNGGVVYHYTTRDRVEQIRASGQLYPSADGNTYVTPTEYNSGTKAQGELSMDTTPQVRIAIPVQNIPNANGVTKVEPANGQEGGGAEVRVPGPVSVAGATYTPIGQ